MQHKATRVLLLFVIVASLATTSFGKGDDFNSVVKLIEQFYNVKHEGLPFLAKAGLKVVGAAAKVKGGSTRRFAELGSVKLALFEDQQFEGDFVKFRETLNNTMKVTWMPLVQTISTEEEEQTYVFVKEKGDKFNVLIVNLSPHEGTVVQATLSSKNLAALLKDPEGAGKAISEEATIFDN